MTRVYQCGAVMYPTVCIHYEWQWSQESAESVADRALATKTAFVESTNRIFGNFGPLLQPNLSMHNLSFVCPPNQDWTTPH